MKILKYVINDAGLPIIFSMDNLHTDILTKVVAAGFVIIDFFVPGPGEAVDD